jgi:DNA-binding protein H-NS
MATYAELLKQKQDLDAQLEEARKAESADAVAKCRELIQQFSLTTDDLFPQGRAAKTRTGAQVAPKYRDPATGQTWTGRGKPPKWIADKNREEFAI